MKNPVSYDVGDKVTVSAKSLANINTTNRCTGVQWFTDEFKTKLAGYVGKVATVTHRFPPGYEMTIEFQDGQAFHAKDHWVEPVMNLPRVMEIAEKHLSDASSRLCFRDAQRLQNAKQDLHACICALKSLAYSVGILHADYSTAWRAAGEAGEPMMPGFLMVRDYPKGKK